MKNFLVVGLLMIAFMVSAQQGGGQGGGQRQGGFQQTPEQREARYEQAKKDLNLNDKQFADYKKIEEETFTKQQAMMQNAGAGNFDRDAFNKMREEQNAKMKAALTADQYKKYEEQQAQRRPGGPGGGGGGNRQN